MDLSNYKMAGTSRYEIQKLLVQMRMLSGRYRTERLRRFWSGNNQGYCRTGVPCQSISETISHIVATCPALEVVRNNLKQMWLLKEPHGPLHDFLKVAISFPEEEFTAFILDPLTNSHIIALAQKYGEEVYKKVCYLTRTFCHSIDSERTRLRVVSESEIVQ